MTGPGPSDGQAPATAAPITMGDLITETEAYEVYGDVLEDKQLRRARQERRIGYLRRKRRILYRRDELEKYVQTILTEGYVEPCLTTERPRSTRPRTTTSLPTLPASEGPPGASLNMTDAVVRRAAERLRRLPFATR